MTDRWLSEMRSRSLLKLSQISPAQPHVDYRSAIQVVGTCMHNKLDASKDMLLLLLQHDSYFNVVY